MSRNSKNFKTVNEPEEEMARSLDQLIEYDEYCASIAPKLREMLAEGKTSQEIYRWAQSIAAAKAVTLINSRDGKVALQAVKEVLDRGVGKAADNINITTRYEDLSDEDIEALLVSQREELNDSTGLN